MVDKTTSRSLPSGLDARYMVSMVKITGRYEGQLRTSATHTPSGARLLTDAPVDNHGKGEAFSPTDLLATSLGCCMLTIMGIVAERQGIDLSSVAFEVEKEMSSSAPRRVARLGVRFTMPASLSSEDRTRLEQAAKTCPVHHSLHPQIVCDLSFDYR